MIMMKILCASELVWILLVYGALPLQTEQLPLAPVGSLLLYPQMILLPMSQNPNQQTQKEGTSQGSPPSAAPSPASFLQPITDSPPSPAPVPNPAPLDSFLQLWNLLPQQGFSLVQQAGSADSESSEEGGAAQVLYLLPLSLGSPVVMENRDLIQNQNANQNMNTNINPTEEQNLPMQKLNLDPGQNQNLNWNAIQNQNLKQVLKTNQNQTQKLKQNQLNDQNHGQHKHLRSGLNLNQNCNHSQNLNQIQHHNENSNIYQDEGQNSSTTQIQNIEKNIQNQKTN
ncbi:hypothetical protein DNTS_009650 [Danionella cerebrum]|uniref:Uncharacterized protein n=1 Tax=Danionella cerebrum TaxID=2873325 RepID=A0A553N4C0_9TELE|nr:hypothetical protein DNTS_009650 [Danionella translucida]